MINTNITKYGRFEHNRLLFGLRNSPATLSRVIQLVLQGLTWSECLGNVLSRFNKYNLKLRSKKCHFFPKEVKYLGNIVNGNGVMITPENVTTMKKLANTYKCQSS